MTAQLEAAFKLIDCVDQQLQPADNGQLPQASPCEAESARIMVIDDEAVNIKVIQKYLRQAGYPHVYNVADGFEGPVDPDGHRGSAAGWKAEGLPWRQR